MFLLSSLLALADNSVFGTINPPLGVDKYNDAAKTASGGVNNIGIIIFISNFIKLATIVAGIWVLFNFLAAGLTYITSQGDTAAAGKVKDQLTTSILGLAVIVAAYTVIALVSLFLFGNAGFILNPVIPGPI